MSYDIRLSVFRHDPLSDQQVREAQAVLDRYEARPFEQSDGFSVRWDDGNGLAMYCRPLGETSSPFSALLCPLGDLDQRFCDFTYDFSLAVGCAIRPDVVPPLVLVLNRGM